MTDFDDLDTMMEDDEDGHPSSKSNLAFSTLFFKPFRIKMKYFLYYKNELYLYQNFKQDEV